MKVRWALALAVVLVLAGCSGLSTGDGAPDRTPYGVEDELEPGLEDPENGSRISDPERLAPGLTALGVDNASVLADRHYEELEAEAGNRTYVVQVQESRRAENGSEVRFVDTRYVVEVPDRWYRTTNSTGLSDSGPSIGETWAENGLQILRFERPNGTVGYHAMPASASNRPTAGAVRSILARASNATVEADASNATTRYRVTANPSDDDGLRNLSFVVREDGFLERISYVSQSEHWPNASASHLRIGFDAPGPASLERPDWFEEGLEETDAELPGNETDDGASDEGPDEEPSDDGIDDEGASSGESDDDSDDEPRDGDADDEPPDETAGDASSDEAQTVRATGRSLD